MHRLLRARNPKLEGVKPEELTEDRILRRLDESGVINRTQAAQQAAEKDPYASLRSIVSLQRTVSTPSLVDFSRASPLDLFEQPARGFFQHPARVK